MDDRAKWSRVQSDSIVGDHGNFPNKENTFGIRSDTPFIVMKIFRDAVRQFVELDQNSALKLAFPKGMTSS